MSISVADFWKLLTESRLYSSEQVRQLADDLARRKPDAAGDLRQVAKLLLESGHLSRYQAKVLVAGKAGPFIYGDYCVYDRAETPRLAGLFRARHQSTQHPVGLQFLAGKSLEDPQALARLAPQVAVARQASRNERWLSACYELVDRGAFKFLVVEDLRGDSLEERLKQSDAQFSVGAACRIVRLAALGAAKLHALGQAHGYVRPANVWLDESSGAKLLQFPFVGDPLGPRLPPSGIDGQLDYLPPELAAAGALADARSDVYSLGCLLFTLLAGKPPFEGGDRQSKLARQNQESPPTITKLNPQTPAALGQVLNYLLQKDPAKRYPDAAAVAEALQAYAGGDPQAAVVPTAAAYDAWLEQPRRAPAVTAPPAAPMPARAMPVPGANGGANVVNQPAAAGVAVATAPAMAAPTVRAVAYPSAPPAVQSPALVPAVQIAPAVAGAPSAAASLAQRRSKKGGQTAATLGVIGAAVLVLLGIVWFLQPESKEQPEPAKQVAAAKPATIDEDDESAGPADGEPRDVVPSKEETAAKEPIQGIGQPMWQSPTHGAPWNLAWLPPGVQVILALRPAELTAQDEWEKLIDKRTLGTLSQWMTDDLPKLTGKTLDQLETVLVGLLDGSPGPPRVALVARASEAFNADDLRTAWGEAKSEEIDGQVINVQGNRAFYVPASGADKLLVIAPTTDLHDMLKTGGEPPPLRREVEVLLESSDDQRQFTLLAAPNFPLTDGKALFVDEGAKLLKPINDFLEVQDSDGKLELTKAIAFSFHLADNLFVELRVYDNFGQAAQKAARELERRVAQLPKQVSNYVRDLQMSPYSKPVLWDYKDQLDVLHRFTRLGVDGKQIVFRAYLPVVAAHNLALGAHLALLENPGSGAPVAVVASSQASNKPQTVAERLKKKTTLSFPRNTLEMSMKLLGDDIGVEIIILGNDLREEGITKNQSFGLDEKDQPADEILLKIMKLANPDGKLVYIIKPKEGGGEDVLYVTTRGAAKKRGDKLPPELEAK